MLPVVRELQEEYESRMVFQIVDYNAADNKSLVSQLGVRGHPSFVALKRDSSPTEVVRGVVEKAKLVELIEAALA